MIETIPFGKTGHLSSRTIFGGAALWTDDPEQSERALALLLEHGVNHIDTAASYGESELAVAPWLKERRDDFFLATKTTERTNDGARESIRESLRRLGTDRIDLIQLHNLTNEEGWQTAMSPGGALEAVVEAREQGLVRFIGVTGHGVDVAAMHLRSLERFPFDSVLFPYNYPMLQNRQYAADVERLIAVCEQRGVAIQTIKGITAGPWGDKDQTHSTWYEPLQTPEDIDLAVRWVLGRPRLFLNTASSVDLLPLILESAERRGERPSDRDMAGLLERRGMTPLFV